LTGAVSVKGRCWIIYDGDCPFCSAYVRVARLKKLSGDVRIINAREIRGTSFGASIQGYDLDEGMLLIYDDQYFHGSEALYRISFLTGSYGWFNKLMYWVFRKPMLAKTVYPALRAGRNLTLWALGIPKIGKVD
jgi:predicted DCC family thiol-disulfide oxidoreductase YuxK